jgi:hypothetical protein
MAAMPEGVANASGQVVADAVYDDPATEPAADALRAPKGWTWSRADKRWIPRTRNAPGRSTPQQDALPDPPGAQDDDPGAGSTADRDPDPAWMAPSGTAKAAAVWDPKSVSRETQDDIAGMLALFYSVPADFLITVDPFCFGALNEDLSATIDATVPIICRSKMAVEFVSGASGLILWIKLLATLKPFFVALWQHHVIHAVELQDEIGEDGESTGKVLVQRQDFSAYTAA